MIPMPVITYILSNGISAFFKYLTLKEDNLAREREYNSANYDRIESSNRHRLTVKDTVFKFTRRYLAVSAWTVYWGAKVVVLLGLAAVPIVYGEPTTTQHGFWIFSWTKTSMQFIETPGVPFTSFDYHMLSAIVGSYFGNPSR